ncbi:telomerase inhibitor [Ophidiomyces ophidiicola]|nr:telomerase inhibitor [Ophidiomyces ophidiicola]
MGLAGPRKRTKISHDPNNTAWSRSTTGYGHRIMSAQGWTPGSFLGVKNAPHSCSYTGASASHIQIVLKDDTLGLGACPRNPITENQSTGLDAFQDLLGRLNGKSEADLVRVQKCREDIKLLSYVERRWKSMTFVPGGLLVQDEPPKALASQEEKETRDFERLVSPPKLSQKDRKKGKRKRKVDLDRISADTMPILETADLEGNQRSMSHVINPESSEAQSTKTRKKGKKETKSQREREVKPISGNTVPIGLNKSASIPNLEDLANLHINRDSLIKVREHRPLGRQVIRGRYIQQKKMALMNTKSLNEV